MGSNWVISHTIIIASDPGDLTLSIILQLRSDPQDLTLSPFLVIPVKVALKLRIRQKGGVWIPDW